jgi:CHAD domain-containing protein
MTEAIHNIIHSMSSMPAKSYSAPDAANPAPDSAADTVDTLLKEHRVDVRHARYVADLALALFDAFQPIHSLSPRDRELLEAGALLHNVGVAADEPNHHIAGRDIIAASSLQGFDDAERAMLACLAAFHRKAVKPANEPLYAALSAEQQGRTLALSALLRIADGLDDSQSQSTEIDSLQDQRTESNGDTPAASALVLKVRGPYSREDAARATRKADLWATLFPPLVIHGAITRPGLSPDDTLAQAGRRILRYQADLLSSDEWRLDEGAVAAPRPKQIHQLRVVTRRLRSTLRVFKPYYKNKAIQPVLKGLRELADMLASVRELDICVSALKRFQQDNPNHKAGTQPLLDAWQAERRAVRTGCVIYLRGERHAAWLQHFTDFVQSDDDDRALSPGEPSYVRHAADLIVAQHVADVRAYDTLPDTPQVDEVHALRIAIKRLRYVAEALREVLPSARVDAIALACAAAQSDYGQMHDAYFVAQRALQFVAEHRSELADAQVQRESVRSILAFASAQQRTGRGHLSHWRISLEPLLML